MTPGKVSRTSLGAEPEPHQDPNPHQDANPQQDPNPQPGEADSAVRRALSILSVFRYSDPVLGVSEISRRLGLPKTTVHRLVTTLVTEGFVERTSGGRYRLTLRLYEMGQEAVQSHGLRQIGHDPLERLHTQTGETTHLAVLSGPDVVYVDRFESTQLMPLFTRVGRRLGAHATSSGKCLLAFGTPKDLEIVLKAGLPRLGPRTITTKTGLEQALSLTRKNGYAVSMDESSPGVASVGAPVFDRNGATVAAVSVAGPIIRMSPAAIEPMVRMVVRTAAEVSRGLPSQRMRG